MTDLSSTLDGLLQKHNARIQQHRRSIDDLTDEFLKQAYRILHVYLRSVRGPYLSTTAPPRTKRQNAPNSSSQQYFTNTQRDAIDAESKETIRDLNRRLNDLSSTEDQRKVIREAVRRKQAERRLGGRLGAALGRWAAGEEGSQAPALTPEEELQEAQAKTTDEWRGNVLWFLRSRLGAAMECQRDMMDRRISREMEKSKSVLYKSSGANGSGRVDGSAYNRSEKGPSLDASKASLNEDLQGFGASKDGGAGLTAEQMQEFAQENNAMLRHYENNLDQVRVAERSMIEIADMQTTLISNLEVQSERIDQLAEDSVRTEENVSRGNKELKTAAGRWRPAKWMFWTSCGLSGFLVVWDLLI